MAYDSDGKVHPKPKDELPIKLPEKLISKQKATLLITRKIGEKSLLMEKHALKKLILLILLWIHLGIFEILPAHF